MFLPLQLLVYAPEQVAEEVFTLSRVVRTFGTEARESGRYLGWLRRLTRVSVRQAAAYFLYLTTNSGLWYLAKVRLPAFALHMAACAFVRDCATPRCVVFYSPVELYVVVVAFDLGM